GVVKWFSDKKGFGFLTLDSGSELFVHFSGIEMQGYKTLRTGQRVRVKIEDTARGPQADRVEVIE
ncbi:MAG TPA: cold-shock protein, partial [Ardenticatenaceae bacterium]|nr:cold-shock protein [Ardenticatenaceae bacterium]